MATVGFKGLKHMLDCWYRTLCSELKPWNVFCKEKQNEFQDKRRKFSSTSVLQQQQTKTK